MDKISGILPSSARIQSVDLKDSAPVRPGVPAFGRRTTEATGRDSVTNAKDTIQKAAAEEAAHTDWRSKDLQHAALAQQVTDRFFAKNSSRGEAVLNPHQVTAFEGNEGAAASEPKLAIRGNHFDAEAGGMSASTRTKNVNHSHGEEVKAMATSSNSQPESLMAEAPEPKSVSQFHPEVNFEEEEAGSRLQVPEFFSKRVSEPARKQPEGLYPRGSFLDRSA